MNHPEEQPVFERGTGNVYTDLGLDDADELFARSQLGFQVWKILKESDLKQREIAALLGIKQPEVSHLIEPEDVTANHLIQKYLVDCNQARLVYALLNP